MDLITTEPKDHLREGDGPVGLATGVEVGRRTPLEPVGIPRRDVVLVQLLRMVHQRLVRTGRLGKTREKHAQRVAPGVEVQLLEERLDRLLRGLVGGERRPVVVLVLAGVMGVAKVGLGLPEPVARAFCHLHTPPFDGPRYLNPPRSPTRVRCSSPQWTSTAPSASCSDTVSARGPGRP